MDGRMDLMGSIVDVVFLGWLKVEYWDDGTGFHQIDNVEQIQPQQVEDTPEVKAAREEHFRIWQQEAERNSKAPA